MNKARENPTKGKIGPTGFHKWFFCGLTHTFVESHDNGKVGAQYQYNLLQQKIIADRMIQAHKDHMLCKQ